MLRKITIVSLRYVAFCVEHFCNAVASYIFAPFFYFSKFTSFCRRSNFMHSTLFAKLISLSLTLCIYVFLLKLNLGVHYLCDDISKQQKKSKLSKTAPKNGATTKNGTGAKTEKSQLKSRRWICLAAATTAFRWAIAIKEYVSGTQNKNTNLLTFGINETINHRARTVDIVLLSPPSKKR